ncbi:hypothetical protein [Rhodococcoides fascians]|uniref:hypothetical protein n=1 Tax=Rhodococcoides fascians TaxID=1828 RepID=UPI0005696BD7|nr:MULTISPECIES: hypothetical protein [Rhodococcus]OZE98100.1 hypothetical protein CH301_17305 [Rhodococcus sp. 15-1189-1-1a]OZF12750.1 hypothetical protein CH299_17990 [Rhodococcus sp. 14-2686-1-2]
MPREFARIRINIADDDDLEELTADAQWLYFRVLIPEPSLNYAGVGDWRPKRLVRKAGDMTIDRINAAAALLEEHSYALFDVDTEEFMVRTLIRSDELLKNPKMAATVVRGYSETTSRQLRAAIVSEVQQAKKEHPDYSSWTHKDTRDGLSKLLSRPNLNTVDYTNQIVVPIGNPNPVENTNPITVQDGNPYAVGNTETSSSEIGNRNRSGTPAPTPAYLHPAPLGGLVSTEGHQAPASDFKPSPNCSIHPNGTSAPCRACGDARKRADAWETNRAAEEKLSRRQVIDDCDECDRNGIRVEPREVHDYDLPAIRCDHTPMSIEDWRALIPEDVDA